jgi:Cellulose biosynthesis protein BcsS
MANKTLLACSGLAASLFAANAFAADVSAAGSTGTQDAKAPQFEATTESDITTRRIGGVYFEGTGALFGGNLDQSGFRARIGSGFTRYDYPFTWDILDPYGVTNFSNLPWQIGKIAGHETGADFMGGYQWVSERWSLLGLIGVGLLHDSLTYPDPTNKVQGSAWGFKTVWELDAHPIDKAMLFTYASYNTAFDAAHVDVRPGYQIFQDVHAGGLTIGKVYLGPQGVFSSDIHDRVWKAGAHLTLEEVGPFYWTFASGYVHDRYNGPGAYFLLDTTVRF